MKKCSIIALLLLCVLNLQAQQTEQRQLIDVYHGVGNNTNYKLYPTSNMYTFLKLDTRYGIITQVQYAMNRNDEFETYLDAPSPLVPDSEAVVGRYELYPTTNIWTFMLLDQITGKVYHVQWSQNYYNRSMTNIPLCKMSGKKDGIRYDFDNEKMQAKIYSTGRITGNYVIPSKVNYAGNDYDIIGIEYSGFSHIEDLISIEIPKNITTIDGGAIYRCNNLRSIVVAKDNPIYDSRKGCNAIIETATNRLVCGCSATIIPQDVTCIGSRAFSGSNIENIVLPSNIQTIEDNAFNSCDSLVSVTLSDSLQTIGENAFKWCVKLSKVVIPTNVWRIGDGAFAYCDSLVSVTLSDSLLIIGEDAFRSCNNLSEVILPTNVKYIGKGAFAYCDSLVSVTLSDSLQTIKKNAFKGCNNLSELIIPANVKNIEAGAFADCKNLKKIEIQATTPPAIDETTFEGLSMKIPIIVPKESLEAYKNADCWSLFLHIVSKN